MSVDGSCASKQTFCALSKQTVKDNSDIKFNYVNCSTQDEFIDNETWNELIDGIIKVYNFGIRGTRNPVNPLLITDISSVTNTADGNESINSGVIKNYSSKLKNDYDYVTLQEYNQILETLDLEPIESENQSCLIYGKYFNDLVETLNNYTLDSSRCNNCNTGCNVYCQGHYTCCDAHCCTQCCTNAPSCTACTIGINTPGNSECDWATS